MLPCRCSFIVLTPSVPPLVCRCFCLSSFLRPSLATEFSVWKTEHRLLHELQKQTPFLLLLVLLLIIIIISSIILFYFLFFHICVRAPADKRQEFARAVAAQRRTVLTDWPVARAAFVRSSHLSRPSSSGYAVDGTQLGHLNQTQNTCV